MSARLHASWWNNEPEHRLVLSERLGLAALFCDILPERVRDGLLQLALIQESEDAARSVLLGQPVASGALQELSPGYRLAAAYQRADDPDTLIILRTQAYAGLQRLNLCLMPVLALMLGAVGAIALADRAEPATSSFPGRGWEEVLCVFFGLGLLNLYAIIPLSVTMGRAAGPWVGLGAGLLSSYLVLGLVLYVRTRLRERGLFRFPGLRLVGIAYLACFVAIPLTEEVVALVTGRDPSADGSSFAVFLGASPAQLLFLGLWAVLVAPFFEEILFRGWLLGGLRAPCGSKAALLISSLLFALGHGNLIDVPALFVLGLILGWSALRSGSPTTSIVVHAMWNATSLCHILASLP